MRRGPNKWALLGVLFVALVLFDQWTKFLAVDRLTNVFERHHQVTLVEKVRAFYGQHEHLSLQTTGPYVVWAPMWRMIYVENPGAAWSLFSELSERTRNVLFTSISVVAILFVLGYYRKLRQDQWYHQVALSMLLAGAVGNFLDRLARGYVIDFIDWYVKGWHWPTFNVADSLIVVGVGLLVVHPGPRAAEQGRPPAAADPGERARHG